MGRAQVGQARPSGLTATRGRPAERLRAATAGYSRGRTAHAEAGLAPPRTPTKRAQVQFRLLYGEAQSNPDVHTRPRAHVLGFGFDLTLTQGRASARRNSRQADALAQPWLIVLIGACALACVPEGQCSRHADSGYPNAAAGHAPWQRRPYCNCSYPYCCYPYPCCQYSYLALVFPSFVPRHLLPLLVPSASRS